MGQTVVFTVSPDSDVVAIASTESRPPRRPFRDAAGAAVRDRRWHAAYLIAFAVPALTAAVSYALTGGAWVTTAFLAAAGLVTPASAAWAAARRFNGSREARLLGAAVAGIAGAALAAVHIPGVVLAARAEGWGEAGAVPTLTVLALAGAAGALLGAAIAAWRPQGARWIAPFAMVLLALLPLALYAALVPTTTVTETVTDLTFTTRYDLGRPAFVCGKEEVQRTRAHTEQIAWVALVSPVTWMVDSATFSAQQLAAAPDGTLAQAQAWTRSTRVGPDSFTGHCYAPTSLGVPTSVREARYEGIPAVGPNAATVMLLGAAALAALTSVRSRSRSATR